MDYDQDQLDYDCVEQDNYDERSMCLWCDSDYICLHLFEFSF